MQKLQMFIVTFIFVYIIYLIAVVLRKKTRDKIEESIELKYLKAKYNIDINKINKKQIVHVIALSNAIIIAITFTLISVIANLILKMLIGFLILIILELLIYHFIGKHYEKKGKEDKNV